MSEPLRILLIDDDEPGYAITAELLKEINGRPVMLDWADDFESGLAGVLRGEHEVYLLDYRLGPEDGIELLRQARAAGSRAPIIILTGQVDPQLDQQALEAGATDYLVKDVFDMSRLEHAIRYALERQRLQSELEQERALLHSLMTHLPDNIYFKDRDSRFLRISHAMARWFGLDDPTEAVGRTDRDFFADEHALQARADELRLMESGEPVLGKVEREVWPDGRTTWVSTSKLPLRDSSNRITGTFGISRDVTEEMQAITALRQSERLNRQIVDTALDAFVGMDAEGRIIDWNPQASRIFGWSREEALGQILSDLLIPARFRDTHTRGLQRFLQTGDGPMLMRRIEVSALHRDGHEFPVEMTIAPIPGADTFRFSAFVHDITNRRKAEEDLRQSRDAAEAASRAKSDFLANMSHEIRTPMNAIIGMTELVLDTRLSESQREYLGMVRDSADSLLTIINDILDFSKIEAGRMEMDAVAFNLRDTLGDTLRLLAVKARKEELELACHIDAQVPETVIGDPVRLRQVVVNLVGNAIKFTPRGEIVVRVRVDQFLHEPPDRPEVLLNFEVRDTGIGISADKMDRIFRPFEQADTSTTRRYGGTGLGLTICSRLVALMHGTMRVESEEGRGSVFHFTARLGVSNLADRPVPPRIVQGTRALIVDDNATNRLILEEMLGNWGLETTSAADVVHALRLMQEAQREGRPYELVVTDLCMPDRDGFDLVEAIRADPALTSSVILMLTSADRPGDLERCQRLGIAQWLRKPIKQSELFDALVAVLRINAVAEATPATEPAPAQPDGAAVLPPLSILLAEDSLVNQKLAIALLSKWGHTVAVAANGREAVEFSATQSFDLILMDVQMPELDGLAAARAIREREVRAAHGRIPIVAMTAHAMAGDRERCLESGMDGYVSKPIRAGTLLEELRRVLPARNEGRDVPPAVTAESASDDSSRRVLVPKYPVDWPACERLVSGSVELLREISEAFVLEAGSLLPGLKQAIEDGDARTAQRLAHTLKGSFRTFGVVDATEIAAGCEQAAKAGDLPVVLERLPVLESAARDVTAQLQLFIGTSRGHE